MKRYAISHLSDEALLQGLRALVRDDCQTTADLLAHLAEVDARRLFLPMAYPSMFEYCVRELHLSEDATSKRIQVARAARRLPAIFHAIAQGHVSLSAMVLLVPHLDEDNCSQVLESARTKTVAEVRELVAAIAPKPDLVPRLAALASAPMEPEHATKHVEVAGSMRGFGPESSAPAQAPVAAPALPPARVTPLAPKRFGLQVTLAQETHDKLRRVQDLLGSSVAPRDLAQVLDLALDALLQELERKRFAATDDPRGRRSHGDGRYVPSQLRREIWQRDGGRCTFHAPDGRRCESRRDLEYDHVTPVAKGGRTCAENLRLLCRTHNQFEAERVLGRGLMDAKRASRRTAIRTAALEGRSDSP
jgi:5-methylcytosine-specific restriction endonuclease McrA